MVAECADVTCLVMIDAEELAGTMFSGLSSLGIEGVRDAGDTIVVGAGTRDEPVACPCCGEEPRACTVITGGRQPTFRLTAAVSW